MEMFEPNPQIESGLIRSIGNDQTRVGLASPDLEMLQNRVSKIKNSSIFENVVELTLN